VIVVEGQFDALRVGLVYDKVVACMGSKITPEKMKKLEMCEQVLLMLDNDHTGALHTPKYVGHLQEKGVQVGQIEYPAEYKDPDKLGELLIREVLSDSGLELKL
jgi:DNA primase